MEDADKMRAFVDAQDTLERAAEGVAKAAREMLDWAYGIVDGEERFDRDELEGYMTSLEMRQEDVEVAGMVIADMVDERQARARKVLEERDHKEDRDWRVEIEAPRGEWADRLKVSAADGRWSVHLFKDGQTVSLRHATHPMLRTALERSVTFTGAGVWASQCEARVVADLLGE